MELAKLHWMIGLSPKEIAERMGRSINTVHWAIRKLKRGHALTLSLDDELKTQIIQSIK